MKQLSKIKLQNAVVLENQEMKMIFGGSGTSNCLSYSCGGESCTKDGRPGTCSRIQGTTDCFCDTRA